MWKYHWTLILTDTEKGGSRRWSHLVRIFCWLVAIVMGWTAIREFGIENDICYVAETSEWVFCDCQETIIKIYCRILKGPNMEDHQISFDKLLQYVLLKCTACIAIMSKFGNKVVHLANKLRDHLRLFTQLLFLIIYTLLFWQCKWPAGLQLRHARGHVLGHYFLTKIIQKC
jgi:hypothetical protein